VPTPELMQGVSQWDVWQGEADIAREWALVENRHQPTALSLRTLVTEQYKLTVYRGTDDGELFDLESDPGELRNRWSDPDFGHIRSALLHRFVQAEIEREPTRFARIASA